MNNTLTARFGTVTAADVAALDAAALEGGIDITQLMEAAGIQVARLAWRMVGSRPRRIHVVAGHGNNGGDGLVAARHLASSGCDVIVTVVAAAERLSPLLAQQCAAAAGSAVSVRFDPSAQSVLDVGGIALFIDALLGTGFRPPLRAPSRRAIAALTGHVLSVDVPSGLDASAGSAPGAVVSATATCTLAAVKRGFWERDARAHLGELHVADIGMPATAWQRCGLAQPTAVRGGRILRVPLPD